MYTVICDGAYLHSPELKDYKLIDPTLTLEANKAGRFEFTILANHPMYSMITRLKSVIEVYDGGYLLFRGRPLNDSLDIYNSHTILCVGELDYLHDTLMPPYEFSGGITSYLTSLINNHNSKVEAYKQFTLGTVTVTDPNNYIVRSNENYSNTWEEINAKLIKVLGGYIVLRREGSINYLDYLSDAPYTSTQEIELTKNILDYQQEVDANDISTIMIPLGAKLKDEEGNELPERLTISSINAGKEYIEHASGVATYGRIWSVQIWEDVNEVYTLKSKAQSSLNALIALGVSITIKAIDLSIVDSEINRFKHLEYVRVKSEPHRINELMLIKKQTIRLDDPSQNTIELGLNIKTFTEKQLQNANVINEIKADYITNQKLNNVVSPINEQISEIVQRATQIELNLENIQMYQTYFKYSANSDGSDMTITPQQNTRYIGTYSGQAESVNHEDYTWTLIKGADGINGVDGVTYYTWLKYAPNGTPTSLEMSDSPENMTHIGLAYNKLSQTESNEPTDYTWSRMRGIDGSDGIDGADGQTTYTWVKYAPNGSPTSAQMSDVATGMTHIGIAVNQTTATQSTAPSDYIWALIKGQDGSDGASLFMAWADDEIGTNFSLTNDTLDYIGLYIGYAPQSTDAADYSWSPSGYKNEKEISEVSLKLDSVAGNMVLKADANGKLVLVRLDTDSTLGSQFSVKADNIKLEGLTTVNDNFKVLTDGSIEVNNGVFKGSLQTDLDASVGHRVAFPINVPANVSEVVQINRNGKGGIIWGYDPTFTNPARAKLIYLDLSALGQKNRLSLSSDGDIYFTTPTNGGLYLNNQELDYKLSEVKDDTGGYTQWASGKLEIWGTAIATYGSANYLTATYTYPIAFVGSPHVTATKHNSWVSNAHIYSSVGYSSTSTVLTLTAYSQSGFSWAVGAKQTISWLAIGRWK